MYILDMEPVIFIVPPTCAANFKEYVSVHLMSYIKCLSTYAERVDTVYDTYSEESI